MQTIDQYHLGFTMRFPRALSIREDLSLSDCITASGAVLLFGGAIVFLTIKHLAILDVVRSEKKRKMENVSEFGFHDYTFDLISVNHIFQEECEEETKENSKGNTTLRTRYPDFLRSQRSQPSVLPEYQGVDLKDVQAESSLFEGLTFSELLA